MGTAPTPDALLEAALRAEDLVRKRFASGQSIRYSCQYNLSNIRLGGVFVSSK